MVRVSHPRSDGRRIGARPLRGRTGTDRSGASVRRAAGWAGRRGGPDPMWSFPFRDARVTIGAVQLDRRVPVASVRRSRRSSSGVLAGVRPAGRRPVPRLAGVRHADGHRASRRPPCGRRSPRWRWAGSSGASPSSRRRRFAFVGAWRLSRVFRALTARAAAGTPERRGEAARRRLHRRQRGRPAGRPGHPRPRRRPVRGRGHRRHAADALRPAHGRELGARGPGGRWVHMENPLERAARDAERVRRWFGGTERDYV